MLSLTSRFPATVAGLAAASHLCAAAAQASAALPAGLPETSGAAGTPAAETPAAEAPAAESGPAGPAALPPAVEAMLRHAGAAGDVANLDSVAAVAKSTFPESAGQIDALVAELKGVLEAERRTELAEQTLLEGWTGSIEAGLSKTTGNSNETGTLFQVDTQREGLTTRHRVNAMLDRQKSDGTLTRNRSLANYQLNRKFSDTLSLYGLAGWERDRFAGYRNRFTESFGIGFQLLRRETMSLTLDAGPAFRQVRFIDGTSESAIAARGSLSYRWDILPTLVFRQDATAIMDESNTFTSNTSLTTKLIGALSARLSYNVVHESDPLDDSLKKTDTAMRVSVVYSY